MNKPIRILYIDDYAADRELVRDILEIQHGGFELTEAASQDEFQRKLTRGDYDLVLSDFNIMGFEGLDVINIVQATKPEIPVVIVTGTGSEEIAVEAMKRGAADYVIKSSAHIRRLAITILAVLEKQRLQVEYEHSQRELRDREEYLRSIYEAAENVAFVTTDLAGDNSRIQDFSHGAELIFGYSREAMIGECVSGLYPAEFMKVFTRTLKTLEKDESGCREKVHLIRRSGERFPALAAIHPRHNDAGELTGAVAVFIDITDLQQAENRLAASLKEKETLLREIHHRVKNNLQVVCSLLNIQAKKINNKMAAESLLENRDRVQSMALIHEMLYQSDDFTNVELVNFISTLANTLRRTYGVHPRRIKISFDLEKLGVAMDRAIPCGLIVNELISNALKHGFPDEREGEIKVALQRLEAIPEAAAAKWELTVADDGVGLPAAFDLRQSDSMGIYLVRILVEDQLKGTIEAVRGKGTTFRIRF